MLTFTRKTDYALVAMAHMGQRQADGGGPCSARRIAETLDLPVALLMNVLKTLTQAQLVHSARGAQGGYSLTADPQEITLLQVVTAIEGPVRLSMCSNGLPILGQDCRVTDCPIRKPVQSLHRRLEAFLESVTLAELMTDAPAAAEKEASQPSVAHTFS